MEAKLPWNFNPCCRCTFVFQEPKRLCCGTKTTLFFLIFYFFLLSLFLSFSLKVVLQLCIYTLHITSLITTITAFRLKAFQGWYHLFTAPKRGLRGLNNGLGSQQLVGLDLQSVYSHYYNCLKHKKGGERKRV